MKLLLSLAGFLMLFSNTQAKDISFYSLLQSGLSIRNTPSDQASVIGNIPYGSKVIMVYENESNQYDHYSININGMSCNWVKVKYNNQIGYVIDAYLSPWAAPKKGTKNLKAYLQQISQPLGKAWEYKESFSEGEGSWVYTAENKKQLYQNGWFISESLGYEYGQETFYIPNISMNQAYCLVQLFSDYNTPFQSNTALKLGKYTSQHKEYGEIEWHTEAFIFEQMNYYNKIVINWSEGPYCTLQILELNDGILISFGAGV